MEIQKTTPIRVVDRQIQIPVTLVHGMKTEHATMLLDTGASITCLTERLADKLGIDLGRARLVSMGMADGSMVDIRVVKVDSISVGKHARPSFEIGILPKPLTGGFQGYLGWDFLGGFPHQLDMEKSQIRWQ